MNPLPEGTVNSDPLTSLIINDKIVFVSFAGRVWQLDLKTLAYIELNPSPKKCSSTDSCG